MEYTNTDNSNGRLRKYIIPSDFDFTFANTSETDYEDAIWEIRYVHNLQGVNIEIPNNVTLQFNGGQITNYGTITLSNTKIDAGLKKIFDGSGSFVGIGSFKEVHPQWFGAINDSDIDSSLAFQAAFDMIGGLNQNIMYVIPPGEYYIAQTINLPKTTQKRFLYIEGYGATLRTDQVNVSIFKRMPINQADAMSIISNMIPVIKGISFVGDSKSGQIGIEIGATYSMVVDNCSFTALDKGLISTFGLQSTLKNLRLSGIVSQPLTIQTANQNYAGFQVWSGGGLSNSASNVTTISNCRVYGSPTQSASYTILGSDSVRVIDCISEGNAMLYDLFFDFNDSTTVKNFYIENFHAESKSKVNFKVKAAGIFRINGLRRSNPAAIFDLSGSNTNLDIVVENCTWWGNMPDIWFYHTNGNGYQGVPDPENNTDSSGAYYTFINCESIDLLNSDKWEANTRPYAGVIKSSLPSNGGCIVKTNGHYTFRGDEIMRKFTLDGFNLLWKGEGYIGKIDNGRQGAPKGIAVGEDGIEYNSGDSVKDVINGSFDISYTDIGTISANSTKSIILNHNDYPNLLGLLNGFVTTVNISDSEIPNGIIIGNVETNINQMKIRFANITNSDIAISNNISVHFNSIKK